MSIIDCCNAILNGTTKFLGNFSLWIERVENATVGKQDLESVLSDDTAFGKLLKDILATPENQDEISGLNDVISDLRKKLPPEVFGVNSVLNLDDNQIIERLVEEAKQMLTGRLLTVGDDQ